MPPALHIERCNTILYCRRWSETVAFYRDVLGLTVSFENDWFVEFDVCAGASVSVAEASRSTIEAVDGQGITITWRVGDVRTAREELVRRGLDVTAIHQRWGSSACYVHDPEGHRLELWSE